MLALLFAAIFLLLDDDTNAPEARWYTPTQVRAGKGLFLQNCAVCHGEQGGGAANWRQRQPDGTFPPPPLDGSAHTWHHPLAVLKQVIRHGGEPLGGTMPAFGNTLSEEEIESVLAYIQSRWPQETYDIWQEEIDARR